MSLCFFFFFHLAVLFSFCDHFPSLFCVHIFPFAGNCVLCYTIRAVMVLRGRLFGSRTTFSSTSRMNHGNKISKENTLLFWDMEINLNALIKHDQTVALEKHAVHRHKICHLIEALHTSYSHNEIKLKRHHLWICSTNRNCYTFKWRIFNKRSSWMFH